MSFFNTKQIALQRVSPSSYLEIDVETSISYYIIDPGNAIDLTSVEYKIDKLSGRATTNVIAWTVLNITGITDDIYQLDLTLPSASVSTSDSIQLVIKATDADGMEYYHKDTEVTPI